MGLNALQHDCHGDFCRNNERECYKPSNKSVDLNTLGIVCNPLKYVDEVNQDMVVMGMSRNDKAAFGEKCCLCDTDVMFQASSADDFDIGGKFYVKVRGEIGSLARPDENLRIKKINGGCAVTCMPMRQLSSQSTDVDALSLQSFSDDTEVRGDHEQNINGCRDDLCRNNERECYRPSNKTIDMDTLGIVWNPFKDIAEVDQYLADIGIFRDDQATFEDKRCSRDAYVMSQAARVDDFGVGGKSYIKFRGEIDTDVDALSSLSFSYDADDETWSRQPTPETPDNF